MLIMGERIMETVADIILNEGVRISWSKELDQEIRAMQDEYAGNTKNKFKNGVEGVKKRMEEVLSKHSDLTREQLHSAILTVTANPAACGKEVSYVVLRYTGSSWIVRSVGILMHMHDELILKSSPYWYPVR